MKGLQHWIPIDELCVACIQRLLVETGVLILWIQLGAFVPVETNRLSHLGEKVWVPATYFMLFVAAFLFLEDADLQVDTELPPRVGQRDTLCFGLRGRNGTCRICCCEQWCSLLSERLQLCFAQLTL